MNAAVETLELNTTPVDASDRLSFTIFIAIAIHALIILGVNFKLPKMNTASSTMEISLATHKSAHAPDRAASILGPRLLG